MGVSCVQQYTVPEGQNFNQALDMLQKRVETLGAAKEGLFCVSCDTYYSAPHISPAKSLHIIQNSEYPVSCFSLLESGLCLVADANFEALVTKMNDGLYTAKMATKIECKGPRYQLVDFLIKLGTVTLGTSVRGILIEVEYQPCVVPSMCWDLIREFMQSFLGPNAVQGPSQYMSPRMNETFTPVDAVQQYMEHFNALRRTATVLQVQST